MAAGQQGKFWEMHDTLFQNQQKLDDASLEALAFIAGRIGAEGIALLVATGGDPGTFGAAEVVELQPLDRAASLTLLERSFGDELSPTVVAEVVDVARGNPLALREIPLSLTPGQRVGSVPFGDTLLTCRSAERAILARITALGEDARRALLVVALSYGEDDAAVARWRAATCRPPRTSSIAPRLSFRPATRNGHVCSWRRVTP